MSDFNKRRVSSSGAARWDDWLARACTLSGGRENPEGKKNERYIWRERTEGHFVRSIRLPHSDYAYEFKATVSKGLLTVHVTKVAPQGQPTQSSSDVILGL